MAEERGGTEDMEERRPSCARMDKPEAYPTEKHFGIENGVVQVRCGGRGLRVIAGRIPAAGDLVGIYKDVGAVLIPMAGESGCPTKRLPTFSF